MNIGQNIRIVRKRKALTQQQLANSLGVSESMVNQIENGVKIPSLLLTIAIADNLNTTVDALVHGSTLLSN